MVGPALPQLTKLTADETHRPDRAFVGISDLATSSRPWGWPVHRTLPDVAQRQMDFSCVRKRQNSLPSGSARTCQLSSPV